jgi:hypothetical protein
MMLYKGNKEPPIYRKSLTKIAIIRTNYIFKIFGYRIQFIEFVKWYLSCIFSVTFKRKVIWYIQIWKHVDKVKNSYVFMLIFILSFCKLICKYSISRKSLKLYHIMLYQVHLTSYFCQWLAVDRWFSPGTQVSSTNKTECHDVFSGYSVFLHQ